MKRIVWIIMSAQLVYAGSVNAQTQKTGITAGVNMSQFNGAGRVSTKDGLIIGGFLEYEFVGGVSLQPECYSP